MVYYHCKNSQKTCYAGSCTWKSHASSMGHHTLQLDYLVAKVTGAQHLTVLSGVLIWLFNLRMHKSKMPTGALQMTETPFSGACWSPCSMTTFVMLQLVFAGVVDRPQRPPSTYCQSYSFTWSWPFRLDLHVLLPSSDSGHSLVPAVLLQPCNSAWSKTGRGVAPTSAREICPIPTVNMWLQILQSLNFFKLTQKHLQLDSFCSTSSEALTITLDSNVFVWVLTLLFHKYHPAVSNPAYFLLSLGVWESSTSLLASFYVYFDLFR